MTQPKNWSALHFPPSRYHWTDTPSGETRETSFGKIKVIRHAGKIHIHAVFNRNNDEEQVNAAVTTERILKELQNKGYAIVPEREMPTDRNYKAIGGDYKIFMDAEEPVYFFILDEDRTHIINKEMLKKTPEQINMEIKTVIETALGRIESGKQEAGRAAGR